MTYLRVLQEIGSLVGNPTLSGNGKDMAKIAFLNAISSLIKEDNFDKSDIPGFVKLKDNINFLAGIEDISTLKVFKILDFFMSPGIDIKVNIIFKETSELNKISAIETLQPTANEVFIYRAGGSLYALTGSTPIFVFGAAASESLTLTFAATGKTINDGAAGNFVTMGFAVGQKLWFVGGGALNVTEMTIVSIQDDAATNDQITVAETILDDVAIAGVLEGFTVLNMEYIEDISDENWTDTTDLQAAADFKLTYTFMQTAIAMAGKALLSEVTK